MTVGSLDVTEDEIQQQFYDDCSSHDKLLQVTEGEVAEGDVVNIDYVGSIDGVEFDGGTDKGVDSRSVPVPSSRALRTDSSEQLSEKKSM